MNHITKSQPTGVGARSGALGVFDSGVGGGTVLRHLHRMLPAEDLLYLADQLNCPYGPRPIAELRRLSAANTAWLLEHGAKLIVVACNTASAAALHWLRETFPLVPFVGMVPAVKPAAQQTRSGVVGVLATPATIQGDLLHTVLDEWASDVEVLRQPCDGLVEQIEAGACDAPETRALLERYLRPLIHAGADTIVLGCTHYPFLLNQIRAIVGPEVALLDAGPAVAGQTVRVLNEQGLRHPDMNRVGTISYATTDARVDFARLLARLDLPGGTVTTICS
jgi:glutamate racemase